jgi:transcription factor SFP1
MEANFMKDYICCGITLDSLHELLQHYEEAHAQVPTQTMGRTPKEHLLANARNANAGTAAQMLQQQQHSQPHNHQQAPQFDHPSGLSQGLTRDPLQDHDMDDMDMDMDDTSIAPAVQDPYQSHQFQPQPQFGRQQARAPSLNIGMASAFQNTQQANNVSTPTTPQPGQNMQLGGFNPTVSSVNTPTFGQTSQTVSPSESTVHTPGEIDPSNFNTSMSGFGFPDMNGQQDESRCIDDPAKRLLSKQGGMGGFKNPSQFANNSELAKRLREQQLIQGFGFPGEEAKPFRCPVIGCEKAYKNQNGLKYHKQVGCSVLCYDSLANPVPAWSSEPAAQGESRRHFLHCRSRHIHPLPWYRRHGEGEALPL